MAHSIEVEIERNYVAFVDMLRELLPQNEGRYALMHDMELKGLFDSPGNADREGFAKFGRDQYSVQFVSDQPVDMGFMSNAIHQGTSGR